MSQRCGLYQSYKNSPGTGFYRPGQQQRLLFPEWTLDKMTITKIYASLRDKFLILPDFSEIGQPCCFILIKRKGHLWFKKCYEVENILWYSSMRIGIRNICIKFFFFNCGSWNRLFIQGVKTNLLSNFQPIFCHS